MPRGEGHIRLKRRIWKFSNFFVFSFENSPMVVITAGFMMEIDRYAFFHSKSVFQFTPKMTTKLGV